MGKNAQRRRVRRDEQRLVRGLYELRRVHLDHPDEGLAALFGVAFDGGRPLVERLRAVKRARRALVEYRRMHRPPKPPWQGTAPVAAALMAPAMGEVRD